MTKLQLAIDVVQFADLDSVITPILPFVDVVEAGTPLIKQYGLDVLRELKRIAPHHELVADMKTMDAGALEAEMAFDAGAEYMTVLGCASNSTIAAAVRVAGERGAFVVADLIGIKDKQSRAQEIAELGVTCLGIHTGTDDQALGANPMRDLESVRNAVDIPVAVAGGINDQTLPAILAFGPAFIIVGSGILGQPDPLAAAQRLSAILTTQPGAGS